MFNKRQSKKLDRAFDKALKKEVKALGKKTLARSRDLVPVKSGELRDSSKIYYTKDGWTIIYDIPYASDVEDGIDYETFRYTMNVKKHKRRLASGKITTVTSHKKQYQNYQRPKQVREDEWRIVTNRAREGVYFLAGAWKQIRNEVKDKTMRNALPSQLSKEELGRN
jgi:hypothetical protein